MYVPMKLTALRSCGRRIRITIRQQVILRNYQPNRLVPGGLIQRLRATTKATAGGLDNYRCYYTQRFLSYFHTFPTVACPHTSLFTTVPHITPIFHLRLPTADSPDHRVTPVQISIPTFHSQECLRLMNQILRNRPMPHNQEIMSPGKE